MRLLTDVHGYPAPNAFLWDRDLRRHYFSGHTFNPLSSLSDFVMLRRGGVGVLWSSLHIPEKAFLECILIRLVGLFTRGGRYLLRHGSWESLVRMLDMIEAQIACASGDFALARSNAELDGIVASGRTAIVHTVEGAHVLDGRLARLKELADRGVASLTLAHLFPNDVAGHVEGIPASFGITRHCRLKTGVDLNRGLTPYGREVVEEMVRLKMIPDLTHCTPRARGDVLEPVNRRVPVVATHIGVPALNPSPYNLAMDEIRAIAASGGVIGVIFESILALGAASGRWTRRDLGHATEHSRFNRSMDHCAPGTDFDGLPTRLTMSMMPHICHASSDCSLNGTWVLKTLTRSWV